MNPRNVSLSSLVFKGTAAKLIKTHNKMHIVHEL